MKVSSVRIFALLLSTFNTLDAFQTMSRRSAHRYFTTGFQIANALNDEAISTTTTTNPSPLESPNTQFVSAMAKRTDLDKGIATKMDETIFKFNKGLIDTIYDLICNIYPVKGNDRDFARFYVLETVARIPYFSYLSVKFLVPTLRLTHFFFFVI